MLSAGSRGLGAGAGKRRQVPRITREMHLCSHAAQPRARATAAPGVRGRALGLDWLHGFHLVGLALAKGGTHCGSRVGAKLAST